MYGVVDVDEDEEDGHQQGHPVQVGANTPSPSHEDDTMRKRIFLFFYFHRQIWRDWPGKLVKGL